MLLTLRVYLRGGREQLLSQELDRAPRTPEEGLERITRNGLVPLGDRESVPVEEIEKVEFVPPPEPQTAPVWGPAEGGPAEARLRDEDVDAALKERRDANE